MNIFCKDNIDYPKSLTKGKSYVLREKIGYAEYLSLIEDDNGEVKFYPSMIFAESK